MTIIWWCGFGLVFMAGFVTGRVFKQAVHAYRVPMTDTERNDAVQRIRPETIVEKASVN